MIRLILTTVLSFLLATCHQAHAITQVVGAAVGSSTQAAPSCASYSGTMAYSQVGTINAPNSGAIRAVGAMQNQGNVGAFVYQIGTNTYAELFSQIPFVSLGTTFTLSVASNPIASPENLIYTVLDSDGGYYFAYRVNAAICGSPSSNCLFVTKIKNGIITGPTSISQRINGILGMTQDANSLYIRTQGTGTVAQDTFPAIHRVSKSTGGATGVLLLQSAVDSGLAGPPYYDPVTDRLFSSSGITNGFLYIIDRANFSLTTSATLTVAGGANTSIGYDPQDNHIYVAESNSPSIRQFNGTSGAFVSSTGSLGGVAGLSVIMDTPNRSIHNQNTSGAGDSIRRVTIPTFSNQNTIAGGFQINLNAANIGLNRIFQVSASPFLQIRSVKTCSTGP